MGRRTVLLVVAAIVAIAGAGMVFVYVKGADDRAKMAQVPVQVLKAVAQIEPGESLSQALAAGKIEESDVPDEQLLEGAMTTIGDQGNLVALTRVFPNEQITSSKFGTLGEVDNLPTDAGDFAISVNLTDTGRVAGFVSPGSKVAIFYNTEKVTRLLLPEVQVIAVAQTTVTTATTTDTEGAQTTETLPRTLTTLAVDQEQAEKILYASTHGELSFGLLNDKSQVRPGDGVTDANLFG